MRSVSRILSTSLISVQFKTIVMGNVSTGAEQHKYMMEIGFKEVGMVLQ